jgi:DNA-binding transcriptional ArsR family regulator
MQSQRWSQEALRRFKAEVFQVLAHPTRIHIVGYLLDGEMAVSAILEQTGIEPANESQHLALLLTRRLVTSRSDCSQRRDADGCAPGAPHCNFGSEMNT